jgi:hypothetical protein
MREERVREALATRLERGCVEDLAHSKVSPNDDLTDQERAELESLLSLVTRLEERMKPVPPSPAFVRSLGAELIEEAGRQMDQRERRHRVAMISAAVAGAVVSIASVVGGVVLLIKWLRTRTGARQASAA